MVSGSGGRVARSQLMSRIRGRDTRPELILRRAVWSLGLRYRLQVRVGRTRPDLLFVGARLAVFLDGCFWHGCPEHYVAPRSSREFWSRKLRQNVERDRRATKWLEAAGWRVLRLWEHEVEIDPGEAARQIEVLVRKRSAVDGRQRLRVIEVEFQDPEGALEKRVMVPLRGSAVRSAVTRERATSKWSRRAQAGAVAEVRDTSPNC